MFRISDHWIDVLLKVSEYNVPFGKKNRGLSVVTSYKMMVPDCTDEDVKLARILGWCVEWVCNLDLHQKTSQI